MSALDLTVIGAGLGLVGLKVWSIVSGLKAWKVAKVAGTVATAGSVGTAAAGGGLMAALGRLSPFLAAMLLPGDTAKGNRRDLSDWRTADPNSPAFAGYWDEVTRSKGWDRNGSGAMHRGRRDRGEVERDASLGAFLTGPSRSGGPADVSLVGVPEISIPGPVTTQPSGTQDVRVTNPMPAPVFNISVTAPSSDPRAIGAAVRAELSSAWNALSRGSFSDGAD